MYLTYPKDAFAGGTWIGVSGRNRLICLLNGGFENHVRAIPYKKSRGLIVKELLKVRNAVGEIKVSDFQGVEPFTIILVDWNEKLKAYELVWDGSSKYFSQLDNTPRIWSSSTLYTKKMKEIRKVWFSDWLHGRQVFKREDILKFHQDETRGKKEVALKMKRATVETVSITCVMKKEGDVSFDYFDNVSTSI